MIVLLVESTQDPCQTGLFNDENLDAGVDRFTVFDELALHRFDLGQPGSVALTPLCAEPFQFRFDPVDRGTNGVVGFVEDGGFRNDTQRGRVYVGVYVVVVVRVWKQRHPEMLLHPV